MEMLGQHWQAVSGTRQLWQSSGGTIRQEIFKNIDDEKPEFIFYHSVSR